MKTNRDILKFAFPAIIENFLQMLVGVSDTFLVSHIGLAAIAAVSLANNIITVYQAIFIALGTIVTSLVARKIAEQNPKLTRQFIDSAVKLTLLIGLVLGAVSILFSSPLTYFFGARNTVHQLSITYLMLVGGFIVLLGLMTTFGSFLRAKGNTKTPMWASFLVNIVNLILSATFIFIFHLGVLGSALGAVFARTLGTVYLYRKLRDERPSRHFLTVKLSKELINLAFPAAGERLAMRFGDLLIMLLIIGFGNPVFAGNSIGESITQFNYMPAFGMATVTVIFAAQEFGESHLENIQTYIKKTYWLATGMMGIIGFSIFLFSSPLIFLFTTNKGATQACETVILFSFLATFFVTGTTTYTAAFQGIGNAKLPFYTTTFGMFVIRLLLGTFFGILLHWQLAGVWFAVLLDNLFRFLFLKFKFDHEVKKIKINKTKKLVH